FSESFLFSSTSNGCDLKAHASRKLNSEMTEPTHRMNRHELAGSGCFLPTTESRSETHCRLEGAVVQFRNEHACRNRSRSRGPDAGAEAGTVVVPGDPLAGAKRQAAWSTEIRPRTNRRVDCAA